MKRPRNIDNFFDFSKGKIMVNLTNRCNLKCLMCLAAEEEHTFTLSREKALEIAAFAIENRFPRFEISGGESLMLDYTTELIEELAGKTEHIQIITNGVFLTNNTINALKDIPGLHVVVSIHGVGTTHDNIVGKSGSFEKADKAVRQMADLNMRFSINSVIQKKNYRQVYKIYDYFSDLPYNGHSLTPVEPWFDNLLIPHEDTDWVLNQLGKIERSSKAKKKNLVCRTESFSKYHGCTFADKEKERERLFLHPGFLCSVPRHLIVINNNGDVFPCYHHKWKDYKVNLNLDKGRSIEDIVYSDNYKNMIMSATGLFGCLGCNTYCYTWDKDFDRKINNPDPIDKTITEFVEYSKREVNSLCVSMLPGYEVLRRGVEKAFGAQIFIWGAGKGGIRTFDLLAAIGKSVFGFIDSNENVWGDRLRDVPVLSPAVLNEYKEKGIPLFVVIGSVHSEEIASTLKERGFRESIDYCTNPLI